MNYIKYNNELYQKYINNNIDYFNNNQNYSLELITYPGKIQTWLGFKNPTWIKITNSFEEDIDSFCLHYYKGFYISLSSEQKSFIISYNEPINSNQLKDIINFFNKIHYIKHYDFIINTIEKIIKRKYDFIDYN
jgi:hypothetical protein